MKQLRGVPTAALTKTKAERRPQPWVGALTLLLILILGIVVALCLQAGMAATVDLEPPTLYYIFFILGIIGMTFGGLIESNGHLPTYHQLHHGGQLLGTIVNAIVWSVIILIWVMYHGDERLKK